MREENGLVILTAEELDVIKKVLDLPEPQRVIDAVSSPTPEQLEEYEALYDTEGADWDWPNSWGCGFLLGGLMGGLGALAIIFTFYV